MRLHHKMVEVQTVCVEYTKLMRGAHVSILFTERLEFFMCNTIITQCVAYLSCDKVRV